MAAVDRGQVNSNAAEVYEEVFVPALFGEWPARVVEAARIEPGQRVLDVACGTGIVARAAAERVGDDGSVTGLDVNEGMLAVAKRKAPQIDWRKGQAESLPFDDNRFDAVFSQFGIMFFEDRKAAVREMVRVLRPGGRLAVAVWGPLNETPGYAAMVDLLQRLFGDEAANGLRSPYVLGDANEFRSLFDGADITDVELITPIGTARFPSIEAWVYTDVKGWVLADMIDDAKFETLVKEAEKELASFVQPGVGVRFAAPAHILSATKS